MVPNLRSERVALSPAGLRDASELWKLVRTPPAIGAFPEPEHGPDGVARWLRMVLAEDVSVWAVRGDGTLVGVITAEIRDGAIAHVGYYFDQAWIERGVATEALRAVAGWLFDERSAHRVELCVATSSIALWRVAQQAGFALEGVARESWRWAGVWHDARSYALLRRDWTSERRRHAAPVGSACSASGR